MKRVTVALPSNFLREIKIRSSRYFVFRCTKCGREYSSSLSNLKQRYTSLCKSCIVRERWSSPTYKGSAGKKISKGLVAAKTYKDLTGHKFGKLVVVKPSSHPPASNGSIAWDCTCECGENVTTFARYLREGKAVSCGCSDKTNKTENAKKRQAEYVRRVLYNLLPGEHEKIIAYQNGLCPISLKPLKRSAVDHDHKTGLVRGVLDWRINQAIAHFNDDPDLLRRAADYLEKPPAVAALGEKVYGVIGRITKKAKNRRYGPDGSKTPQLRRANVSTP